MPEQAFIELSTVILTTLVVCGIMRMLRQPIMIGYIISGILLSPNVFNLLQHSEGLQTFSQIGISFLLFMVGIGLNPKNIKEIGKTAIGTAVFQILLTFALYFGLSKIFGFNNTYSLYIAIGLSFNSTIVIMKMLSDKLTLETLPGKISVGILIIQDLLAMIILMLVSATSQGGDLTTTIILTLLKGTIVISILFYFSNKFLPYLTKKVAHSQELLLLFSISWCMALASLFHFLNFSIEIGALLAGVTLSLSPYRYEITAKMRPLRDFFIMLFFVLLGSQLVFKDITSLLLPIIVLSISVLIINPLIITFLVGRLGYTKKTSFLSGVNFSQVSEFSLILATLGLKVGHLDNQILSLLTMIGLISITGSTYFINYSEKIYLLLSPYLKIFELSGAKKDHHKNFDHHQHEIVLIGYSKLGPPLIDTFQKLSKSFFIVDYDPKIISELGQQDIDCFYGDISNPETFDDINFHETKMVISTIKDLDTNLLLINKVRQSNPQSIIITLSHQPEEALKLYEQGSNYVIMPYYIGGHHTSSLISEFGFDLDKFLQEKQNHIKKLLIKKQLRHNKGL